MGLNNPESTPNRVRRPSLFPARRSTTEVSLPKLDEPEEPRGFSAEELILRSANEGTIDLGDEEQGFTPEQIVNRATVKQAAQAIPRIVEESRIEFTKQMKESGSMSRALSAANNFYLGLTQFVPGALKTKVIMEAGLKNLWLEGDEEIDPMFLPEWQAAVEIGKTLEDIFPTSVNFRDEFWAGTMSKASGQFTGNIVLTLASGGVGLGARGAATVAGLANATLQADTYKEAKDNGADDDTAFGATILNMAGVGALEALPMAQLAKRVDKGTGGGIKRWLASGASGSLEEGITEAMQEMFENATAKALYDDTRNLMQGVGTAAAVGALLGGVANIALPMVSKKALEAPTVEENMEALATLDMMFEEFVNPGETPMTRNDMNEFIDRYAPEGGKPEAEPVQESEAGVAVNTKEDTSAKFKKKFKDLWQRWFAEGGKLGKPILVRREKKQAQRDKQIERAFSNMALLNRSILEHYGSEARTIGKAINDGDVPIEISSQVDAALRDESVRETLPKPIAARVKQMRRQIDLLSYEFAKEGLVQGELLTTFRENLGSYIHRSYKLFDPDTEWGPNDIPADVWNNALKFMKGRIRKAARESGDFITEASVKREAEQQMVEILRAGDVNSIRTILKGEDAPIDPEAAPTEKRVAIDKADRNILKERQDIAKPIRDLMGEFKDPAFNYINTIDKMASFIESRKFYDDIVRQGRGAVFKTKEEVDQLSPDEAVQWTNTFSDGGIGSELGEGKWFMHRDTKEGLTKAQQGQQSAWLTLFYRANGMAKYAKTAASHVSHFRNVAGGTMFLGFNGHMFSPTAKDVRSPWDIAKTVFQSYEKLDAQGRQEMWENWVALGLSGGSVRAGEFNDVMSDAEYDIEGFMHNNFNHASATAKGAGVYKQSKSWFKKWSRKLSDLYAGEDAFLRIWMFELEKARLQNADPNITDAEVAELVNDLYPNYNRLNETLKLARRLPFFSPFISFPAEVVRTTINTGVRAKQEIESDNPKLQEIGWQRITGMATTSLAAIAAGAASQALLRIGDDEEEAIRQFLPPWSRNSTVVYLDANHGRVRYVNTSYTNPYEFLLDPAFALLRGDSDREIGERFFDTFKELFDPLLSEEIFFKHVREFWSNQTSEGAEIWNPQDTIADKLQKGFLHLWNAVEPGSITSAERFFEPLVDEESEKQVSDELYGFFGLRISTIDIPRSYGFRIRDFRQDIRDARRVYNSVKFRETSSQEEKLDALQRANEQYRGIFREMVQITDAAVKTGVDMSTLEEIMKESGLANRDINAIQTGNFAPFEP